MLRIFVSAWKICHKTAEATKRKRRTTGERNYEKRPTADGKRRTRTGGGSSSGDGDGRKRKQNATVQNWRRFLMELLHLNKSKFPCLPLLLPLHRTRCGDSSIIIIMMIIITIIISLNWRPATTQRRPLCRAAFVGLPPLALFSVRSASLLFFSLSAQLIKIFFECNM